MRSRYRCNFGPRLDRLLADLALNSASISTDRASLGFYGGRFPQCNLMDISGRSKSRCARVTRACDAPQEQRYHDQHGIQHHWCKAPFPSAWPCRSLPIEPMVPVPGGEYTWLARALDLGARGA